MNIHGESHICEICTMIYNTMNMISWQFVGYQIQSFFFIRVVSLPASPQCQEWHRTQCVIVKRTSKESHLHLFARMVDIVCTLLGFSGWVATDFTRHITYVSPGSQNASIVAKMIQGQLLHVYDINIYMYTLRCGVSRMQVYWAAKFWIFENHTTHCSHRYYKHPQVIFKHIKISSTGFVSPDACMQQIRLSLVQIMAFRMLGV